MTRTWLTFTKWTILGSLGLVLFYFLLASLVSRSLTHSLEQFIILQPWMSLLVLSFGIQVGLYQLIRKGFGMIGGTSATSGVSMVVCCAHHISDFLPILGMSGLGLMLTTYQKDFLILGVILNIFGVIYLTRFVRVKSAYFHRLLIAFAGLFIAFGALSVAKDIYTKTLSTISVKESLPGPQTKQVGMVEVEVAPKQLSHGRQIVFTLRLNNHSIDLNYDFAKIAVVVDSSGNIYEPVSWSGGMGGHHVSGDLAFGKLSDKAENVGLNITGIDNQKVVFEWKL